MYSIIYSVYFWSLVLLFTTLSNYYKGFLLTRGMIDEIFSGLDNLILFHHIWLDMENVLARLDNLELMLVIEEVINTEQ